MSSSTEPPAPDASTTAEPTGAPKAAVASLTAAVLRYESAAAEARAAADGAMDRQLEQYHAQLSGDGALAEADAAAGTQPFQRRRAWWLAHTLRTGSFHSSSSSSSSRAWTPYWVCPRAG